jgi:hypothetical protein
MDSFQHKDFKSNHALKNIVPLDVTISKGFFLFFLSMGLKLISNT